MASRVFACARIPPPRTLFGPAHRRLVPHIYTEAKLCALLDATAGLAPVHGLRPATCRCVFGLLAASGLRISEALGLARDDVDLVAGVLRICEAKFNRERLVPVHPSVTVCQVRLSTDRVGRSRCPTCRKLGSFRQISDWTGGYWKGKWWAV